MRFDEALRYLLSLGHETLAIKLGLRNTVLLLETLGNPHKSYESVQIAGTNGKGSTAVVLDSICRAAGIHTGLFTSPHLIRITERIKVNGKEISEATFARLATEVRAAAERLLNQKSIEALPTFFEQVTAIALLAFKEAEVDLAILETGLGGRLDSTTAACAKVVAITPISLDHQEYLGETLVEIAAEKAAIIRPGVTAIVAPQAQDALAVILNQCKLCGVNPRVDDCRVDVSGATDDGRMRVTFQTSSDRYEEVLLGLSGRHQITNVSLAVQVSEALCERGFPISQEAIVKGTGEARHPGRLELCNGSSRVLFDGAHNPAGTRALREYLDEFINGPITIVFGAMRDKNLEEMAESLFSVANLLVLTQPDSPRAASMASLQKIAVKNIQAEKIVEADSAGEAYRIACQRTSPDGLVCVTGSLYLIGEIKAQLFQESRPLFV
jgi:dihydrofolate synthase / folylpolyglutamate synthase